MPETAMPVTRNYRRLNGSLAVRTKALGMHGLFGTTP
jgi:hypothetical protein